MPKKVPNSTVSGEFKKRSATKEKKLESAKNVLQKTTTAFEKNQEKLKKLTATMAAQKEKLDFQAAKVTNMAEGGKPSAKKRGSGVKTDGKRKSTKRAVSDSSDVEDCEWSDARDASPPPAKKVKVSSAESSSKPTTSKQDAKPSEPSAQSDQSPASKTSEEKEKTELFLRKIFWRLTTIFTSEPFTQKNEDRDPWDWLYSAKGLLEKMITSPICTADNRVSVSFIMLAIVGVDKRFRWVKEDYVSASCASKMVELVECADERQLSVVRDHLSKRRLVAGMGCLLLMEKTGMDFAGLYPMQYASKAALELVKFFRNLISMCAVPCDPEKEDDNKGFDEASYFSGFHARTQEVWIGLKADVNEQTKRFVAMFGVPKDEKSAKAIPSRIMTSMALRIGLHCENPLYIGSETFRKVKFVMNRASSTSTPFDQDPNHNDMGAFGNLVRGHEDKMKKVEYSNLSVKDSAFLECFDIEHVNKFAEECEYDASKEVELEEPPNRQPPLPSMPTLGRSENEIRAAVKSISSEENYLEHDAMKANDKIADALSDEDVTGDDCSNVIDDNTVVNNNNNVMTVSATTVSETTTASPVAAAEVSQYEISSDSELDCEDRKMPAPKTQNARVDYISSSSEEDEPKPRKMSVSSSSSASSEDESNSRPRKKKVTKKRRSRTPQLSSSSSSDSEDDRPPPPPPIKKQPDQQSTNEIAQVIQKLLDYMNGAVGQVQTTIETGVNQCLASVGELGTNLTNHQASNSTQRLASSISSQFSELRRDQVSQSDKVLREFRASQNSILNELSEIKKQSFVAQLLAAPVSPAKTPSLSSSSSCCDSQAGSGRYMTKTQFQQYLAKVLSITNLPLPTSNSHKDSDLDSIMELPVPELGENPTSAQVLYDKILSLRDREHEFAGRLKRVGWRELLQFLLFCPEYRPEGHMKEDSYYEEMAKLYPEFDSEMEKTRDFCLSHRIPTYIANIANDLHKALMSKKDLDITEILMVRMIDLLNQMCSGTTKKVASVAHYKSRKSVAETLREACGTKALCVVCSSTKVNKGYMADTETLVLRYCAGCCKDRKTEVRLDLKKNVSADIKVKHLMTVSYRGNTMSVARATELVSENAAVDGSNKKKVFKRDKTASVNEVALNLVPQTPQRVV